MKQQQPEKSKAGFHLKLELVSSSEQSSPALKWAVALVALLVGSPSLVKLVEWITKGVG